MNERQRRAILAYGSNPSRDPLAEEKFRNEFYYAKQKPEKKSGKGQLPSKPSEVEAVKKP